MDEDEVDVVVGGGEEGELEEGEGEDVEIIVVISSLIVLLD